MECRIKSGNFISTFIHYEIKIKMVTQKNVANLMVLKKGILVVLKKTASLKQTNFIVNKDILCNTFCNNILVCVSLINISLLVKLVNK